MGEHSSNLSSLFVSSDLAYELEALWKEVRDTFSLNAIHTVPAGKISAFIKESLNRVSDHELLLIRRLWQMD